jgi:hypothetical protein
MVSTIESSFCSNAAEDHRQCVQAGPSADGPAGNVIGASFAVTIDNTEQTAQFYRAVFELTPVPVASFARDDTWTTAAGLAGAEVRASVPLIPATELTSLEFRRVDRAAPHSRLQDPATPILRLLVTDLAAVMAGLNTSNRSS